MKTLLITRVENETLNNQGQYYRTIRFMDENKTKYRTYIVTDANQSEDKIHNAKNWIEIMDYVDNGHKVVIDIPKIKFVKKSKDLISADSKPRLNEEITAMANGCVGAV